MAYKRGTKVKVTKGMFKGRNAKIVSWKRKDGRIIYTLNVEGYPWPFALRGTHLRRRQ